MSGLLTPGDRPNLWSKIGDLSRRVANLEATPASSDACPCYVDDQILQADAEFVLFDTIPAGLRIMELTWAAFTAGMDGSDAMIYVDFNGDTLASPAEDYRWNLTVTNQQGTQGSATDGGADTLREGGAIGYAATGKTGASNPRNSEVTR